MGKDKYSSEISIGKEQLVGEIMKKNWSAFLEWRDSSNTKHNLNIPQTVADVLIPKKILEISQDPNQVHARIMEGWPFSKASSKLFFLIRERLSFPLTDPEQFEKWRTDPEYFDAMSKFAQKANIGSSSYLFTGKDLLPNGVDYMYAKYYFAFGKKGTSRLDDFSFNDKVYLHYRGYVPKENPNVVVAENFYDRPELHGKGIGTSFFDQLDRVYKALEFKYIVGQVESPNKPFFEKRMQRNLHLPQKVKDEIPSHQQLFDYSDEEKSIEEKIMVQKL